MAENIPESQLSEIESVTLRHYESNASSFWQGTKDHDVTQNYDKFLSQFPAGTALDILDFGCGPGRDLGYFQSLGHRPVGLDGSESFCDMAQANSGCPVLQQQFLSLNLPNGAFDGVFANASLFHIPGQELPRVLKELHSTLRPQGILFSSNPRGNSEGWSGQRYGHFIELEQSLANLKAAGFEVLEHYYRPAGVPRSEQPWLAIVSRRVG
ncbi:MAG: SAM-dependent methyltransferase [Bacteroidia bacterium]|jgi:SAM-dependent methyltransferase